MAPKDLDGLIVQRKKLNQLHARHEQLVQNICEARDALGVATQVGATIDNPFADLDLSVPSAQDNPYPRLIEAMQDLQAQLMAAETLDVEAIAQHVQHLETCQAYHRSRVSRPLPVNRSN